MNAIDFPLKYHLSPADRARLLKRAQQQGHTPDTYVETLIKRDIFAVLPPDPRPPDPQPPASPAGKGRRAA